jgi:hypothetical protein
VSLPTWVKLTSEVKDNVYHMCCVICLKIESKEKLFVLKLENLLMHIINTHKIKFNSLGVKVGFFISTLIAKVHVMKRFTISLHMLTIWI